MTDARKKISAAPSWLGLTQDREKFLFLPERAEIVRRIFALAIGGMGSYAIANYLNEQHVPPFGRSPGWDHTTIDSMLRNRATYGEYQAKSFAGGRKKGVPVGAPIPNYYPAVIDKETFESAQIARRQNLAKRGRKGNDLANIFQGVCKCAYCDSEVIYHRKGDFTVLICAKVLSEGECSRTAWSYPDFERTVLAFLAHPALGQHLEGTQRDSLTSLVEDIEALSDSDQPYVSRVNLAMSLKQMVALTVHSAGAISAPRHPSAQIRKDVSRRFLEISLWAGPPYRCISVG